MPKEFVICYYFSITCYCFDSKIVEKTFFRSNNRQVTMSKAHPPELKKFMDKRIHLRINGSRQVS